MAHENPAGAAPQQQLEPSGHLVHLVRHAVALDRRSWDRPDAARPLTVKGEAQSRALASRYLTRRPDRLLSSPALRCVQTLQPTAGAWSAPIVPAGWLAEGRSAKEAERELLAELGDLLAEPGRGGCSGARRGEPGRAGAPLTARCAPPEPVGTGPTARLLLACTHGDVLEELIEMWVGEGLAFEGRPRAPKAGTVELDVVDGSIARALFVPPPEV